MTPMRKPLLWLAERTASAGADLNHTGVAQALLDHTWQISQPTITRWAESRFMPRECLKQLVSDLTTHLVDRTADRRPDPSQDLWAGRRYRGQPGLYDACGEATPANVQYCGESSAVIGEKQRYTIGSQYRTDRPGSACQTAVTKVRPCVQISIDHISTMVLLEPTWHRGTLQTALQESPISLHGPSFITDVIG